jgi:hypothetical protein
MKDIVRYDHLRIQALESLDFSGDAHDAQWKQRLSFCCFAKKVPALQCSVTRSENIQQVGRNPKDVLQEERRRKEYILTSPRVEKY